MVLIAAYFQGLGVGVLGGLTAILTNTYNESRKDGLTVSQLS